MPRSVSPRISSAPVLRWVYANGPERLFCELTCADDSSCELRIDHLSPQRPSRSEHFPDVTPAFVRHCDIEARLIAAGWNLEFFEKRSPLPA
jgi:hypothetical protein